MSENFSGEQKLRIVLESIIRNVPRSEQSKKYGVSEEEFQSWHDHLIKNGGNIFDSSRQASNSRKYKKKMSPLAKFFLTLSLFFNLGLIVFFVVYISNQGNEKEDWSTDNVDFIDSPVNLVSKKPVQTDQTSNSVSELKDDSVDLMLENARERPLPNPNDQNDIGNLLALPEPMPKPLLLPAAPIVEPVNEVTFMGKEYKGRHVVYLLDVGTYVLESNETVIQFNKAKDALVSSIVSLSPNSYFNLVLYWNLREVAALGKTILKASSENKKYAIDWISSLGDTKESIKSDRNQYYPKELLYADPAPGIIGPWYGLSTAISFDPDLVFVFAGNVPNYDRSEVPRSHYEGLGKINFEKLQEEKLTSSTVNPLVLETALKWFYAITPISSLPTTELEVETMALARLGLASDHSYKPAYAPLAWHKAFDNFLSSLEVGFDRIPQTHFMVNLPRYVSLPSSLINSVKEFTESSRGSYTQNILLP